MTAALGRLVVEGFRSIRHLELDLTTDVTVLIGANGSGKSNLVSALELVSRVVDNTATDRLTRQAGVARQYFDGPSGSVDSILIELTQEKSSNNGLSLTYRTRIENDINDQPLYTEELTFQDSSGTPRLFRQEFGPSQRSEIQRIACNPAHELYGAVESFIPLVSSCRVFHFDDVSANAPVKGFSTVGDDVYLRSDAENIAAYLFKVRNDHPRHYQRIVSAVRHVTPFFDDFVLVPDPSERIRLRWKQRGLDRTFLAHEASDGTLRFICLATLLLGPDLPATVVLDEPELGLHPAAIGLLAEMTHIAGRNGHKVILATQSVPLLSHFDLEEVVVLERVDGATQATRPDRAALEGFLEDYSTGSLWEMNLLGGRPAREGRA